MLCVWWPPPQHQRQNIAVEITFRCCRVVVRAEYGRNISKKLFSWKTPVWRSTLELSQIQHPFFSLFSFIILLSFRQIGWAATPHSLQSGDQGGIASPSPQVHAWTAIYLATLLEVYEDVFLLLVVATSLSFSTFPAKTIVHSSSHDPVKKHTYIFSTSRWGCRSSPYVQTLLSVLISLSSIYLVFHIVCPS